MIRSHAGSFTFAVDIDTVPQRGWATLQFGIRTCHVGMRTQVVKEEQDVAFVRPTRDPHVPFFTGRTEPDARCATPGAACTAYAWASASS
jgi:hypothetical protein